MNNATIPDNLKLVLDHLSAVRELDRYFRKKSVYKDLERYTKDAVAPSLLQRVPTLTSWECDIDEYCVELYPQDWKLDDDRYVSLYVIMPNPADPDPEDSLPSVNLWVPTEWAGHDVFRDSTPAWRKKLKKAGFEHIADHKNWDTEFVFAKSVNWLREDGSFEEANLIERISLAAGTIVELEPEITQSIREATARCPDKKRDRQLQSKKKSG